MPCPKELIRRKEKMFINSSRNQKVVGKKQRGENALRKGKQGACPLFGG
jgi:hypothetical protein